MDDDDDDDKEGSNLLVQFVGRATKTVTKNNGTNNINNSDDSKSSIKGRIVIGEMLYWLWMEIDLLDKDTYFMNLFKRHAVPTYLLSKYRNEKLVCRVLSVLGYDLRRKRKICQEIHYLHPSDFICRCCGIRFFEYWTGSI